MVRKIDSSQQHNLQQARSRELGRVNRDTRLWVLSLQSHTEAAVHGTSTRLSLDLHGRAAVIPGLGAAHFTRSLSASGGEDYPRGSPDTIPKPYEKPFRDP